MLKASIAWQAYVDLSLKELRLSIMTAPAAETESQFFVCGKSVLPSSEE